jgi:hypothetical protein
MIVRYMIGLVIYKLGLAILGESGRERRVMIALLEIERERCS